MLLAQAVSWDCGQTWTRARGSASMRASGDPYLESLVLLQRLVPRTAEHPQYMAVNVPDSKS